MTLRDLTVERALTAAFREQLESNQTAQWLSQIAMDLTSDQGSESYRLLLGMPGFQEWKGPLTAESLSTQLKTITNTDWHSSFWCHRDDWDFKKFGVLEASVGELASGATNHQYELVTAVLNDNGLCIDGQNFFDTDHSTNKSGTQSNSISVDISALPAQVHGTIGTPSLEEMGQAIKLGARQIRSFNNAAGKKANVSANQFMVMVPSHLADKAEMAIGADYYTHGVPSEFNGTSGRYTVVDNPILAEGSGDPFENAFVVFRTDSPLKPLALQTSRPVDTKILGPDSEHAVTNPNYLFSAQWSGAAANMFWSNACKVTLA